MENAQKLPRSLQALEDILGSFQPPSGPFQPNGSWDHRYAVLILVPDQSTGHFACNPAGAFRLRRAPADGGTVALEACLGSRQADRSVCHAHAKITCAADRLVTPRRWELRSEILDRDGNPVEWTALSVSGGVTDGRIVRRCGKAERAMAAPERFTSNWSLFDALQRLPADKTEPLTFDMFEELELHKPNQRLAFRQTVELELGGRAIRLHGFEQLGEGILPYNYWLDDQRRLLLAIGGLRAFVFDPAARMPEEKA